MGIEDIQISEELETNAPSIKYKGEEGPKSPQQIEQMMIQQGQEMDQIQNQEAGSEELMTAELDILKDEYLKYVFEMEEQGLQPMSFREFLDQTMAEKDMSSRGPIIPSDEDPINPFGPKPIGPPLPDRQMAAYGGIMGIDGRRKYGLGSRLRKLIPNELAKVAEVAAPFVAPFNPLAAGLMSGIGGYDRTGNIGSSLKSGLINYGLGQGARFLGGADFQTGFDPRGGMSGMKYGFSKPTGSGGIKEFLKSKTAPANTNIKNVMATGNEADEILNLGKIKQEGTGGIMKAIKGLIPESTIGQVTLGGGALALGTALLGDPGKTISQIMNTGEGLDLEAIRAEVLDAYNDETGEKLLALRAKYPYLGRADTKDFAMGGRIGFSNGGRMNYDGGGSVIKLLDGTTVKIPAGSYGKYGLKDGIYSSSKGDLTTDEIVPLLNPGLTFNQGGRVPAQEGGIMDLGGMEKDYRAEGGFVPIGKEEKADDVPARLSVNEFVFTADAVRNAGGGDIDRGAEVMENMMKNLEAGGQVSEESQGMQGAQQMFETSERLSEVI